MFAAGNQFLTRAISLPYVGSFNGSTQYLTVPDNAAFNLAANDFTIECWVKLTSIANSPLVAGQLDAAATAVAFYMEVVSNGSVTMIVQDASGANRNTNAPIGTIVANTWYHIALVRNGNTNRQYINGVQTSSVDVTGFTVRNSTDLLGVGCGGAYVANLPNGYISNFRLVNGTCLYPSGTTFTPPTAPLTAVTNTALLTLQNATIVDNSSNHFTITNSGTVVMSQQKIQ
jgi:hypothetical protein